MQYSTGRQADVLLTVCWHCLSIKRLEASLHLTSAMCRLGTRYKCTSMQLKQDRQQAYLCRGSQRLMQAKQVGLLNVNSGACAAT